jgi:hypothetical protein
MFDGVWNTGQPSEIYEFAFKRYLADIVEMINSYIPPLVETTAGTPDGEATAAPAESARTSQSVVPTEDELGDIHALLKIVKTTESHSSKSASIADLMRTGVLCAPTLKCFPEWDHVTGQADGEPDWDDIQQSLETLQTQLIKETTTCVPPPLQTDATTVSHVRTSNPKAQGRKPKLFTKEEVLTLIVKTSASVHSFETPETLRKAVRGALKGQKDVDKATEEFLGLWALLQGKSSKTGTASYKLNSSLELYPLRL